MSVVSLTHRLKFLPLTFVYQLPLFSHWTINSPSTHHFLHPSCRESHYIFVRNVRTHWHDVEEPTNALFSGQSPRTSLRPHANNCQSSHRCWLHSQCWAEYWADIWRPNLSRLERHWSQKIPGAMRLWIISSLGWRSFQSQNVSFHLC